MSAGAAGFRPRTKLYATLSALALAGGAVGLVACDDDDGSGGTTAGGSITLAQTSQPDFLDPALGYTVNAIEPMWLVYTPLLTYPHVEGEEGTELIPGLAEDLPEVSEDGLTYDLTMRDGLTYSDGTDVKASDFEHAVKRVLNLESGGSSFFEYIDGATDFIDKGDPEGDISGIETDDKTGAITITLAEPYAAFPYVLGMWFGAPVPGDTPFENLTEDPAPGVGSYVITKSVPNREFVMERREDFADLGLDERIPAGNIDTLTIKIIKDQAKQSQDVINNDLDYMQDPPTADLKPEVRERFEGDDAPDGERYEEFPTSSTYYFFMNVRTPPFDDPKVREAVNLGIDKPALARLYAGELQPGCAFTPPGTPGYDEEFDTTGCPYGDPSQPPDLEGAQELLREAGADGAKVTVWGNNDDPTDKVTQAYTDMLNEIGFDAEPKIIDGGIYFQTIGNEETAPQTGFSNWFLDWPHPQNLWFLVDPDSIQPTNNQNYGNVDDPHIKKELDELNLETSIEAATPRWRDLDSYLVSAPQSYVAPYGHRKLATFVSERIDFESAIFHAVYYNDYSSFQLSEGE